MTHHTMSRFTFVACTLLITTISACSDTGPARSTNQHAQSITPDSDSTTIAGTTSRPPWQLIGSKLDDDDVEQYLSRSSGDIERENTPGYGVFVSLYREGIELSADTSGTITTVIIYGQPPDQYAKYSGPMPRSLTWDLTRADVEAAIGKPATQRFAHNFTTGRDECYVEYPGLDMYFNYNAKSDSDMQAKLIDIRIKNAGL